VQQRYSISAEVRAARACAVPSLGLPLSHPSWVAMGDTAAASFIGVAMGDVQFRHHGRSSEHYR